MFLFRQGSRRRLDLRVGEVAKEDALRVDALLGQRARAELAQAHAVPGARAVEAKRGVGLGGAELEAAHRAPAERAADAGQEFLAREALGERADLENAAALEGAALGVRVNVICPGPTGRTLLMDNLTASQPEMKEKFREVVPMGRVAEPEEMAEAVIWFCSDAASFVTGQILSVDGGMTAM